MNPAAIHLHNRSTAILLLSLFLLISWQAQPSHADTYDHVCAKDWHENQDDSGRTCCTTWRMTYCFLNAIQSGERSTRYDDVRQAMREANCGHYAEDAVNGHMPLACFTRYRLWAVILMSILVPVAFIAIVAVFCGILIRRRRQSASSFSPDLRMTSVQKA